MVTELRSASPWEGARASPWMLEKGVLYLDLGCGYTGTDMKTTQPGTEMCALKLHSNE